MGIVSYILEEVLITLTALSSIHAVVGLELHQLGAVAGVAVLCALAVIAGLAGLVALAAGAVTAVTGGGCNDVSAVCALAGGVTAVGGGLHQLQVGLTLKSRGLLFERGGDGLLAQVWLTFDLCAAVVLRAQDVGNACIHWNQILMQRMSRALCYSVLMSAETQL